MANRDRLQMLQAIVTRLGGNSSALKGWTVTIATGVLGVAIHEHSKWLAALTIYTVLVLGLLDAYYLALERKYRDLYQTAIGGGADDWALDAGHARWSEVLRAALSPSVWLFYASALGAAAVVAVAV